MRLTTNAVLLHRIEAIGFLLTLVGIIIKFTITDNQNNKMTYTDRNFYSYQVQYNAHDIQFIKGKLSPGYISGKGGFTTLANYLAKGTSYYVMGLDMSEKNKTKIIDEMQKQRSKIIDNHSYLEFKSYCQNIINTYANSVYKQFDRTQRKIKYSSLKSCVKS